MQVAIWHAHGADGVVKYASAHLDDAEAETVVRGSGHSTQANPVTIDGVRRILTLQLAAVCPGRHARPQSGRQRAVRRWARRSAVAASACLLIAAGAWSMAAVHYAARGPAWLGSVLAALVLAGLLARVLALPWRWGVLAGLGVCGAVLVWWLSLTPSNTRDWEPEYAVTASAGRDGDRIVLTNVRNATYSPDGAITPAYYDAEYRLDQLDAVDLISSYWSSGAIAHVFLSFFSDRRHVAISADTRRGRCQVGGPGRVVAACLA